MIESAAAPRAKDLALSGLDGDDHVSLTQALDEAAVEEVDDDYWDVDSDAEMMDMPEAADEEATILGRDFSLMRKIQYQHTNEFSVRRYDAFIYEGVLAFYKAEQVANPLKNPKTARVFAHFIHVTAPVSACKSVTDLGFGLPVSVTFNLRAKSPKSCVFVRRIDSAVAAEFMDIHPATESFEPSGVAACHAGVGKLTHCKTTTSFGNPVVQTLWSEQKLTRRFE